MVEGPILIVDDDPLFRDSVGTALELHGFDARLAADGREALEAIEAERPALVLLDLSMPGMNGAQLLEHLTARDIHVPVVIVTAGSDGEALARKHGIAAYLRKPVAVTRLLDAISACRKRAVFDESDRGAA